MYLRLIMLDIDGVLNTARHIAYQVKMNGGKPKHFMDCNFDPAGLKYLKQIVDETDAYIVISSTWRITQSDYDKWEDSERLPVEKDIHWNRLVENLDSVGLADRIIGVTPRLHHPGDPAKGIEKYSNVPRGEEIDKWLKDNKDLGVTSFVIIDDDSDMAQYTNTHLAQTDFSTGIIARTVEKAIKILKEVPYED